MKISDMQIDRFGAWSGLKIETLSDRLTVFYGPNEAGKTTLLQFVRGVLYGFAEPARLKYLAQTGGQRFGGTLHVASSLGEFWLRRQGTGDPRSGGTLTVLGRDGMIQPDQTLHALLGDVDEAIFNNVFALGLRELQELGTLSDTEAATLLYRLTSGLDRVSLLDVIRELENSRNRILAPDERPCLATQLLAQRERLRAEIEELKGSTQRWNQIKGQSAQLGSQIAQLEKESKQLQRRTRTLEAALAVGQAWQRRNELNEQLAQLDGGEPLVDDALEQLAALKTAIHLRQQKRKTLYQRRRKISRAAAALRINRQLWRQTPRIEALGDQHQWAETLSAQVRELEGQLDELQTRRQRLRDELGLSGRDMPADPPLLERGALEQLKPAARAVRQAKEALKRTTGEITHGRQLAQSIAGRLKAGLQNRQEATLAEALEVVGARAALLRRRVSIDERIAQMEQNRRELEDQSLQSLDRQLLPIGVLAGLGLVFVLGVVLLLANIWAPNAALGTFGWLFAGLGICVTGAVGLWKMLLERSAANHLKACNQQLDLLNRQLAQTRQERDALDAELPRGGGALAARLQTAERELAALEELVPLEAQRQAALGEAAASDQRVERLRSELKDAHHAWRDALVRLGLPSNLSPKQVRQLLGQRTQSGEVQQQIARVTAELEQRRGECSALSDRIGRMLAEVGMTAPGKTPGEQIQLLVAEARSQEEKIARRRELKRRWTKLKRHDGRLKKKLVRIERRRRALLAGAGVQSEDQFRRRVEQWEQLHTLQQERDTLAREIAAALGSHTSEEEITACLAEAGETPLESLWEQSSARLEANETRLRRLLQQRGELAAQERALSDDERLSDRQLELGMVEQRLQEALADWQVRAVAGHLLESLRQEFEQHRQPETLLEASLYLSRLTGGHYVRVWTPLDEDLLYVDDDQGQRWSVDLLSCGTREQLFLSLRLALIALYARRGVHLPVVLDDVLVNFDEERAKAAAALLRDFAKGGHQLLVFTCHEYVWKMFKTLKADVRRLPALGSVQLLDEEDAPYLLPAPAAEEEEELEVLADEEIEDEEDDEQYEDEELEDEDYDEEEEELEDEDEELAAEDEDEYEEEDEEDSVEDEQWEEDSSEEEEELLGEEEELEGSDEQESDEFEDEPQEDLDYPLVELPEEQAEEEEPVEALFEEEPADEVDWQYPQTGPFGWDVELEEDGEAEAA